MRTTTSDEWRRQLLLGGGLVCHALLLGSCSSSEGAAPPPAPVLTTLTVALAEPSIQVGRTTMASVAGRDQFGATMAVSAPTWSAAPSTVATIGSSGVATGVSPGQATITGTVGSLSAAATLTVTPPPPVLTTLTVSLASATVTAGQATQATASGRDQFGAPIDAGLIVWSVASPAIASINTSGTVTAMGAGQTAIRASSGSIQGTTMLTVIPGPANRLILVTAAAGIVSGVPFTTQPIVSVRDAFGNAVASDNSTAVTMTASSGATVIGTATRTAVSGQVTFTNLGIGGTVGATYTLTFTSAGLVASSQNVTTVPATFGNGTRIVGTDIPAGLFRSPNATSASCYWARLSGFGGTLAEILANDIGGGPSVVAIATTDRGFESSRCATWTQITGPATSSPTAPFDGGTFMVGTDIAPGTWRSGGTGTSCYWARLRGFGGTLSEIIANNVGAAPAIVTIAPTDIGFTSSRCGVWSKIG